MRPLLSDTLAGLRQQFATKLTAQANAIHVHFLDMDTAAWQPSDAEALQRLLNDLADSSALLGMSSVSDTARDLGVRLGTMLASRGSPAEADWQAIGTNAHNPGMVK